MKRNTMVRYEQVNDRLLRMGYSPVDRSVYGLVKDYGNVDRIVELLIEGYYSLPLDPSEHPYVDAQALVDYMDVYMRLSLPEGPQRTLIEAFMERLSLNDIWIPVGSAKVKFWTLYHLEQEKNPADLTGAITVFEQCLSAFSPDSKVTPNGSPHVNAGLNDQSKRSFSNDL